MSRPADSNRGETWQVVSNSEAETVDIGRAFGRSIETGDAVLLIGELGAGKTRFVQGMAEGVGSPAHARSPTFVLVNPHRGRITLNHCDLYRISTAVEAADLGFDEMLEDGAIAVEWADRARSALPLDALDVAFSVTEDEQRDLAFTARGQRSERLLKAARGIVEAALACV